MLHRVQKEVLAILFLMLVIYPVFKTYRMYKEPIQKVLKGTGFISKGILDEIMQDTVGIERNMVQDTFKFNLNEVSWEALTLIPGIGEYTAKKIVTYRLKNGRFRQVEDLLKIKGIGRKTIERLKPYVYVH